MKKPRPHVPVSETRPVSESEGAPHTSGPMPVPGFEPVATYRFVIRAVLWVIYLAVVLALVIWWVRT